MKIAQIVPPFHAIPPTGYGGTERVVSLLTEGLVKAGHEVTLFASADSITSAELRAPFEDFDFAVCRYDWRLSGIHAAKALRECVRDEFDLVHNHDHVFSLAMPPFVEAQTVTTLHIPSNLYTLPYLEVFPDNNYVAISHSQLELCPPLTSVSVIYNGVDISKYRFQLDKADYLVFLGSINRGKGVHLAVQAALQTGLPLKIAAKLDPEFKPFYKLFVEPYVKANQVEYLGELGDEEKIELLAGARALLLPITWDEPFGLVMVEALSCGTPVIAFKRGSASEIIVDGEIGYVVSSFDAMVDAIKQLENIRPEVCRRHVEANFSADRMVANYEQLYRTLIASAC